MLFRSNPYSHNVVTQASSPTSNPATTEEAGQIALLSEDSSVENFQGTHTPTSAGAPVSAFDDDSSDEEMNDEPDAIEVSKLPTIAKDDETVKRKLEKAKRKPVRAFLTFLIRLLTVM